MTPLDTQCSSAVDMKGDDARSGACTSIGAYDESHKYSDT